MNESKFDEIYDEYKVDNVEIIDTVTQALKEELSDFIDSQDHCDTIVHKPDHAFYAKAVKDLHRQANLVRDLGAFISEYYRRIDPATGLGLTEKQFSLNPLPFLQN